MFSKEITLRHIFASERATRNSDLILNNKPKRLAVIKWTIDPVQHSHAVGHVDAYSSHRFHDDHFGHLSQVEAVLCSQLFSEMTSRRAVEIHGIVDWTMIQEIGYLYQQHIVDGIDSIATYQLMSCVTQWHYFINWNMRIMSHSCIPGGWNYWNTDWQLALLYLELAGTIRVHTEWQHALWYLKAGTTWIGLWTWCSITVSTVARLWDTII